MLRISYRLVSRTYDARFYCSCRCLVSNTSVNDHRRKCNPYETLVNVRRNYSAQQTVESIVQSQSGIFRFLSESTPVEYTQKLLLTIHDTTLLPWWATIVCTTLVVRGCITFPLAIYQHYIMAKLENLKHDMSEIVEELKRETALAVRMYQWDERMARIMFNRSAKKQWKELIIRENCHPFKASLLLWVQIPMWVSLSVSLRNLVYMLPVQDLKAHLTCTELAMGGVGFIPNLTVPDGSWILPVALGLTNLAIIELQVLSKTHEPSKLQRYLTNIFRGFSIFMVPIAACVPSCLSLYWTVSSVTGLTQNLLLLSPKFRRFCKIPKTDTELEKPYEYIANKFKHKIESIPGMPKIS